MRHSKQSKGKSKGESETRYCYDCGEHGNIGMNCPCKMTKACCRERVSVKEKRQKNSHSS